MLTVHTRDHELFDDNTLSFRTVKAATVRMEHSLISLSKWESVWKQPFLPNPWSKPKTREQLKSYISMMIIGPYHPDIIEVLWTYHTPEIQELLSDQATATVIRDRKGEVGRVREIITSEIIYARMIALDIWLETERWNINRLMTLINVRSIDVSPPKKMSAMDTMAYRAKLNRARLARKGGGGDAKI